jgi:restriction endonuclease S subunit
MNRTTLEEVSEFITDGTHGSPKRTKNGSGVPLLSAKNIFDGEVRWDDFDRVPPSELEEFEKRVRLKRGDVLMTCVGSIGRATVWLNGGPVVFFRSVAIIRPKPILFPKYLEYVIRSADFQQELRKRTKQSSQGGVYLKDIRTMPLVVPPLAEQERIVRLLDDADELRKLRDQADRRTADLIPALFNEMFGKSGKKGWHKHSFGDMDVLQIIDGDRGANYPRKTEFHEMGDCLFLNTSNVRKGRFDFSRCDFITREKDAVLRKGKLVRGDVILTTRGTVGNSAHYDRATPYEDMRINSGMVVLRANPTLLLPEFLLVILNSDEFANQVSAMTSGSAQPQLPINRLSKIEFVLPPLALQKGFVQRVTECPASAPMRQIGRVEEGRISGSS